MIYSVVLASGVSKVNQLYIYPLFLKKFFSHIGHCRILSRVLCIQQVLLVIYFTDSSVFMSIPDFLRGLVVSSDCPGHSFDPWWESFMCLAAWPKKKKKKYLNCGLLTRGRRFQAEGTTRGIHQKDKKVQSSTERASSYSGLLHCDDVASAGRGNC